MNKKVSVIILNYNGKKFIEKCLTSVINQTYKNVEIVVVDNASKDGSKDIIKSKFSQVKLIESSRNLGFAAGNNLGVENAKGEFIFFLNNDAYLEETTLQKLAESLEKIPDLGILGCRILNFDGSLQESGVFIDRLGYPINIVREIGERYRKDIFYVSGCALFIRKALFEKLGEFEDDFFMFVEDVDLAWRVWLLGLKVWVDQSAIVYHYGGASLVGGAIKSAEYITTPRRVYFREAHTLSMLIRNYELRNILIYVPFYFIINLLEVIFFLCFFKPRVSLQYFRAWFWNMIKLKTTLKKRRIVQSMRKVSDGNIQGHFFQKVAKLYQLRKLGIPKFA